MAVMYNVEIDGQFITYDETTKEPSEFTKAEAQKKAKLLGGRIVKAEEQSDYDNRHMFRIPKNDMEKLDYITTVYFGGVDSNKAAAVRFLINKEYRHIKKAEGGKVCKDCGELYPAHFQYCGYCGSNRGEIKA